PGSALERATPGLMCAHGSGAWTERQEVDRPPTGAQASSRFGQSPNPKARRSTPSDGPAEHRRGGASRLGSAAAASVSEHFRGVAGERLDHEAQVLVEGHAQLIGAALERLAIDRGGEARLLELLLDRLRRHPIES